MCNTREYSLTFRYKHLISLSVILVVLMFRPISFNYGHNYFFGVFFKYILLILTKL